MSRSPEYMPGVCSMFACDQFYTKDWVAEACFTFFLDTVKQTMYKDPKDMFFIEPSAGRGAFFERLPLNQRMGLDIDPQHPDVLVADFFTWHSRSLPTRKQDTVVIGNPPFGQRSRLAVQFFNRAAEIADTIAFILPVTFRKYRIHKQLHHQFTWIASLNLPKNAFFTTKHHNYPVNTEFQVWTSLACLARNKRLFSCPLLTHTDFTLYQYNNTQQALKVFHQKFHFAVPAQGYQDYTRRVTCSKDCEKNKQWMLFGSDDQEVRQRLWNMDYHKIAYDCGTVIPGFRKNDVIREYMLLHHPTKDCLYKKPHLSR